MKNKFITLILICLFSLSCLITVHASNEMAINVSDPPQVGSTNITVLMKKHFEPGHQSTQSLAGAVFEVKHYANTSGSTSGNPIHTWYFETEDLQPNLPLETDGKYGISGLNPKLASGYTSSPLIPYEGHPHVWPLGTYTIQEVKIPTSYQINPEIRKFIVSYNSGGGKFDAFVRTPNGSAWEQSSDFDVNEPKNDKVNIDVHKGDLENEELTPQGNAKLSGIRFAVVLRSQDEYVYYDQPSIKRAQGEVVEILTTDENGYAVTSVNSIDNSPYNLRFGTYEVIELRRDATIAVGDNYDNSDKLGSSIYANSSYLFSNLRQTKECKQNNTTFHYGNMTLSPSSTPSFANRVVRGGVHVYKKDEEINKYTPQGDASLAGIRFAIVNKSTEKVLVDGTNRAPGQVVKIIETNEAGEAWTTNETLPFGLYGIYELREDATIQPGDVYEGSNKLGSSIYANKRGVAGIAEREHGSMLWADMHENFTISYEHEMVGMGTRRSDTGQENEQYITDDQRVHYENRVVRGGFEAYKVDKETMISYPLEGASLAGIEFTLKNASKREVLVNGTLYQPGDVIPTPDGKQVWTTDNKGWIGCNNQYLPYGTYTLQETKTNDSYHLTDGQPHEFHIRIEEQVVCKDDDSLLRTKEEAQALIDRWVGSTNYPQANLVFPDQVKRGPIEFHKVNENGEVMRNIPWKITNTTTGEVHYIISDVNGYYNSEKAKHSKNTNAYDDIIAPYVESNTPVPQSVLDEAAEYAAGDVEPERYNVGLWFSLSKDGSTHAPVDDDLGPLPYGTYTIEEVRCEANQNKELVVDTFFIFSDAGDTGRTIHNENITLETEAMDNLSHTDIGKITEQDEIRDNIVLHGLYVDRKYRIHTELHYAPGEAGSKVDGGIITDNKGNRVEKDTVFVASAREKTDNIYLSLDSRKLYADGELIKGADCVIFEYIYEVKEDGTEEFRKAEINPNNKAQTIYYPWIGTTLTDEKTQIRMGFAREDMVIIDRVEYRNFPVATKYEFEGYLVDKDTGEPALDADGNRIESTLSKRIQQKNGVIEMVYRFNGKGMDGKTLVAYEAVDGGDVSIEHYDIDDEAQNFHIPKIRTVAKDKETQDDVGKVVGTFVDTVNYENLIPGYKYTMYCDLMWQDTNRSSGQTGSKQFTAQALSDNPNRSDGSITLEVPLNLTKAELEGRDLVAFEELKIQPNQDDQVVTEEWLKDLPKKEELLAEHKDINDPSQTVNYPKIRTLAIDKLTEDHVGTVTATNQVVDTVEYWNLVEGRSYTIEGTLYDVNGTRLATATPLTFTATAEDVAHGTKVIRFDVNTSQLDGHTVVCYEKLIHNNVEVTQHEENNDETQRVHYPWMQTVATDANTGDHVGTIFGRLINSFRRLVGDDVEDTVYQKVIDKVDYKNTISSEEYTFVGTLMNKESGQPILGDDGNPITSSAVLKAGHPVDCSVNIEFSVDSSKLQNVTIVCYEKMFHKNPNTNEDIEVNRHEDLNDENQSVHDVALETEATDTHTNDHIGDATGPTTIVDDVYLDNLVDGMEYELVGTPYIKETGQKLTNPDGSAYTPVRLTFTAEGGSDHNKRTFMMQQLYFDVDGLDLQGKTVVIFEDLYHNGVLISLHADINDEAQSVHYPKVNTLARDKFTNDHVGTVTNNDCDKDKITLENLIPGEEYTIVGKVMKYGTDQALMIDGEELIVTETFTAKEANEVHEMSFPEFDSNIVRGETIVIFEYLYHPRKHNEVLLLSAMPMAMAELSDFNPDNVLVAQHADPVDEDQSVHYPWIKTIATDRDTGDHVGTILGRLINSFRRAVGQDVPDDKFAGIIDTVEYKNLIPDQEYTITGVLMNKETGEKVLDESGKEITASTVLKANEHEANGEAKVYFDVDTSLLENITVVCFEKLFHNDVESGEPVEIDRHEDLNDEDQSVHNVKIRTHAVDSHVALDEAHNDWHTGDATGTTIIHDDVTLENLVNGMEYTLKGTLHYKDSGEPVLDKEGKPYETILPFKVEEDTDAKRVDLVKRISFEVDGKALEGKTVVAFEELFHNDISVAIHADLSDEDQSVYYPWIRTHATNNKNGAKEIQVTENTEVVDRVEYKNLLPGKYKILGVLMDKETGEDLIDSKGEKITQELEFTIASVEEGKEGYKDLVFTFDSTTLASHIVVAYETLVLEDENNPEYNVPIAEHKDINDEEQSIWLIDIATHLTDKMTNSDEGEAREEAVWNDHVSYLGLKPGKKYTLKGTLMDKETGEPFVDHNGNQVVSTIEFVPETKDGFVDLEFRADTRDLAGHSVVAFEELYPEDLPDVVVAEHKDINDKAQTVNIIEIRTNATDAVNATHLNVADPETVVIDRVTYTNLTVGREYILKAILMDKATGEPVLVNDQQVTQEVKFTPEEPNGFVDVNIPIDTSTLEGVTVVCYEQLFNAEFPEVVVAHHEDINDEDQSIHIPKIRTTLGRINPDRTVIDKVEYKNLIPGIEYTVKGYFVEKATANRVEESDGVIVFTPTEPDGTIDMTLNANSLETLVAFEELYIQGTPPVKPVNPEEPNTEQPDTEQPITEPSNEVLVAKHADLEDAAQTAVQFNIKVLKADKKDPSKYLEGAEITVFDQDGNVMKNPDGTDCIGTTDENGEVTLPVLHTKDTSYYIQETKAPKGYEINDTKFDANPDNLESDPMECTITILDGAIIIPPTGDYTNIIIFAAMLILMLALGSGIVLYRKKKLQQ